MHECNPVLVKLAELRSRFPPSGTLDRPAMHEAAGSAYAWSDMHMHECPPVFVVHVRMHARDSRPRARSVASPVTKETDDRCFRAKHAGHINL